MERQALHTLRILFGITAATLLAASFLYSYAIPTATTTCIDTYYIQLFSIATLGLIPAGIIMFGKATKKADKNDKKQFLNTYRKWGAIRILLPALCCIANIHIYHAIEYNSAIYCVIIGAIALIYSYPTKLELHKLTKGEAIK